MIRGGICRSRTVSLIPGFVFEGRNFTVIAIWAIPDLGGGVEEESVVGRYGLKGLPGAAIG